MGHAEQMKVVYSTSDWQMPSAVGFAQVILSKASVLSFICTADVIDPQNSVWRDCNPAWKFIMVLVRLLKSNLILALKSFHSCFSPWMTDKRMCKIMACYLVLLVRSSVPRLQKSVGLGAARGLHSIFTWPPRAAGTSFLTGFSLKSGAWTGNQDRWTGQNNRERWKGREDKRRRRGTVCMTQYEKREEKGSREVYDHKSIYGKHRGMDS